MADRLQEDDRECVSFPLINALLSVETIDTVPALPAVVVHTVPDMRYQPKGAVVVKFVLAYDPVCPGIWTAYKVQGNCTHPVGSPERLTVPVKVGEVKGAPPSPESVTAAAAPYKSAPPVAPNLAIPTTLLLAAGSCAVGTVPLVRLLALLLYDSAAVKSVAAIPLAS